MVLVSSVDSVLRLNIGGHGEHILVPANYQAVRGQLMVFMIALVAHLSSIDLLHLWRTN